jgi:hypothetical protein
MREQNLDTPDIAQLVRVANAGDGWAWEVPVDRGARLIWASTPQVKRAAQLHGVPASAGSWCARRRSVSCPAGVLRQGYS